MSTQDSAAKYVELSSQAYELVIDTLASASRSRLDYWKSVWEVFSRPYASTAIESAVRENFDRANELSNLTVGELRARGKRTAEFSEKFLTQVSKLQDAGIEVFRDTLKAYASGVEEVKEAAAALSSNGSKIEPKPASIVAVSN